MADQKGNSYQLGDVLVNKLTITSNGKTRDITPQVVELFLYEDILTPYLFLTLEIHDAIGLLRTFPIIGEETVELEFETPGRDKYKAKFKTFEIEVGSATDNQSMLGYRVSCCSEEAFEDAIHNVEKGYKETIDVIVKDILQDTIKTKKKFFYEPSKGIQNITFTRKNAFAAIDFLRKRAVSQKYTSSTYFFFENKYGFNFNTLEGIMDQNKGKIGDKIFTRHVILNNENQNPQGFRQILSYNVGRQFNMLSSLSLGALNGVHQTFDILRKEFKEKKYTIKDFPEFKNAEENGAVSPFGTDTISKYGKDVANYYYNISNSANPDTYLNDNLMKKIAFSSIQLNGSIDMQIHGDSSMTIGDVLTLKMPKTDGTTKTNVQPEPLQNGNYVVTRMNHHIQFSDGRPKYLCILTAVRGIYKQ
jgi:hypothetical protein